MDLIVSNWTSSHENDSFVDVAKCSHCQGSHRKRNGWVLKKRKCLKAIKTGKWKRGWWEKKNHLSTILHFKIHHCFQNQFKKSICDQIQTLQTKFWLGFKTQWKICVVTTAWKTKEKKMKNYELKYNTLKNTQIGTHLFLLNKYFTVPLLPCLPGKNGQ